MNLFEIRKSLIANDNLALRYLYVEFGDYCTQNLIKKRRCAEDEADEFFVEAVMILREKVLNGTIDRLTNTRYYLYKTCENLYLARLKSDKAKKAKMTDLQYFFYESEYTEEGDTWDEPLSDAATKAWAELTERCKDILYYFYVDALGFAEIVDLMDLSSVDVAKTTKARCYKRLVTQARQYYENPR